MTQVMFHFNVPDKVGYACRLLQKAYAAGGAVGVVAEPEALQRLDGALWSFSALAFVPHCVAGAPARVRAASPIVLAAACAELPQASRLLVHLGLALPQGFERFERLIELVGTDAEDRSQARLRWRHYAERGYVIQSHDAAPREEPHVQ